MAVGTKVLQAHVAEPGDNGGVGALGGGLVWWSRLQLLPSLLLFYL